MKKNLMGLGVVALFGMMGSTMSAAIASCDSFVTAASVNITTLNNGGLGCTEGGVLFNNFLVVSASPGPGTAEIDVPQGGITFSGGEILFSQLNPNLGGSTSGVNLTDIHFSFTMTGYVNGGILGVQGSGAVVNEINCNADPSLTAGTCNSANTLWNAVAMTGNTYSCQGNVANPVTSSNSPCQFASLGEPTGTVYVFKDISIASTAFHLTNFSEGVFVPEPVTTSLMGFGLLAIGLIGKRLRK